MAKASLKVENDVLYVAGDLNLRHATALLKSATNLMAKNAIKDVDFTETKDSDTTGVLLMLNLQRLAKQPLKFTHVPDRLRGLLNLTNLTHILTIAT